MFPSAFCRREQKVSFFLPLKDTDIFTKARQDFILALNAGENLHRVSGGNLIRGEIGADDGAFSCHETGVDNPVKGALNKGAHQLCAQIVDNQQVAAEETVYSAGVVLFSAAEILVLHYAEDAGSRIVDDAEATLGHLACDAGRKEGPF